MHIFLPTLFLGICLISGSWGYAESGKPSVSSQQNLSSADLQYAGPNLNEDAYQLSLGADYILWEIAQDGLETAGNFYSTTAFPTQQGQVYFPKFKLRNGFKVHAQKILSQRKNVDLFAEYTWLQTNTYADSGALPEGSYFYPGNNAELSTYYSSSYQYKYNVFDFELGRLSAIAQEVFSIRPFFGLRGVWNSSTWISETFFPSYLRKVTLSSAQKTSGAGIRGGIDLSFDIFEPKDKINNLKLIASTAASGIYGSTSVVTQLDVDPEENFDGYPWFSNVKSSMNRIIPIIDLSIGLSWNKNLGGTDGDRYNLEIHALWDTQAWINYGKHQVDSGWNTMCLIKPQTLTVQGLTIGGSLEF